MKRLFVVLALLHGWTLLRAAEQHMPADPKVIVLPQVSALTLNPTSVIGGAMVNGTVTLAQAAGSGGVTVKFHSSNHAIAAVPEGVVVQPGASSATFVVQTNPLAVNPNVVTDPPSTEISAQVGTSTTKAKLTVMPPTLSAFTFNPTSVAGGTPANGQVTITGPAPSSGLAIALSVAKTDSAQHPTQHPVLKTDALRLQPALVTVPPQVVIPSGATSASFQATTRGVSTNTPVQITASHSVFATKTATVTLTPPQVASVSESPKDPVGGTSLTGTVTMTAPVAADGAPIALSVTSSDPYGNCGPAPVIPSSVSVAGGSTSATFPITTLPGSGSWRLSAGGKSVDIFVRQALIALNNSLIFPQSIKGGTTVQAKLQLIGAANTNCGDGSYALQSSNTNLARVPATVTVANGSSTGTFSITTSAVPSTQTVDISVR